jgi:Iap family predicted aminopeptidase
MSNGLESMSVDELQSYLSDFHKDFYGFRPRGIYTPAEWQNPSVLIDAINRIHNELDEMKKTAKGREQLRADGWQIDESEFV